MQASEHPRPPRLSSQTLLPGFPGNTTFPTKSWARAGARASKYPEPVSKQIRPWGAGERLEVHREDRSGSSPQSQSGGERGGESGCLESQARVCSQPGLPEL